MPALMETTCHCIIFRRISRLLTARYDAALAPFGITTGQYSLLMQVKRGKAVSLTQLGRSAELDRSTIGRNIRVLERMGLVALGKCSEDERETLVTLTDAAFLLLAQSEPVWNAAQKAVEDQVGIEKLNEIKNILNAL